MLEMRQRILCITIQKFLCSFLEKKIYSGLTRLQIPEILHMMKVGYQYFSFSENKDDIGSDTDILIPKLTKQF